MILIVILNNYNATLQFLGRKHKKQIPSRFLLRGIDQLLNKNKVSVEDIKGIILLAGEASFSAARQTAAILNTIAFVLQIPITALKLISGNENQLIKKGLKSLAAIKRFIPVNPLYSRPPSITKPKNYKT